MKRVSIALALMLIVSVGLTGCGLTVPRPEIKSGEFDFTVTYEYDGEIRTVSGVYACEYNGTDWALDGGYHRDWVGYIKGGGIDEIIEIGTAEDGGEIKLNLAFYPEYFMDDSITGGREAPAPWISVVLADGEGMIIQNEADVIEAIYGARIISYEYDKPIENSFGLFK